MLRPLPILVAFLFLFFHTALFATPFQAPSDSVARNDSIVGFGKRFSFHTNVIDWCIAMPNLGIEWDFSGKRTSRYSLGVHAKYRPATWNKVSPRFVFNTLQVRGEIRKYWRTFVHRPVKRDFIKIIDRRDTVETVRTFHGDSTNVKYEVVSQGRKKTSFFSYFIRRYLSGVQTKRARNWRAYYIGLYAEYDKFTYHIKDLGRQGSGAGFGITMGYTLPLYPMKKGGSIDLDLGLSVGARMQSYDKFAYEEETHCYAFTGIQERAFVKHPVLADAHVSFVYRFNSISNKVQGCEERFERRMARHAAHVTKKDKLVEDTLSALIIRSEAIRDSLKLEAQRGGKIQEKIEKEKAKAEKAAAKEKAKAEKAAAKEAKEVEIKEKKDKNAEKAAAKEQTAKENEEREQEKNENNTEAPTEAQEQKGGDE